jgi:hypothetical protein
MWCSNLSKATTVERRTRRIRRACCCSACSAVSALVVVGTAAPASAQSVARFALDSVVSVDEFAGQNASDRPQIVIDVSAAVRIGDRWQLYVRPWFRLPRPSSPTTAAPSWDKELYQAGVRYERPGAIATRLDAGYILSPIGLGLLDSRPNLNPTIVPHLSYVVPMPSFDATGPRVVPVASSYPLGAQLTASTTLWDARAAIVNSAPARVYVVGATTKPRQTPVFVSGAGLTPRTGLRLGASFAHGEYATPAEITSPGAAGRSFTMAGGEGELAFGYTKIRGEIIRTAFDTSTETAVAYEWFLQGIQTVSPRWFLASRGEGTSAPPPRSLIAVGQRTGLSIFEATAGFRASPEITLRGSYYARRSYGATTWDNQAGVSIVWARRWW